MIKRLLIAILLVVALIAAATALSQPGPEAVTGGPMG